MSNDLISREALKKALHNEIGDHALSTAIDRVIDNAPTVEGKLSDKQIEEITDLLEEETMKLIIDISQDCYDYWCEKKGEYAIANALINGIPYEEKPQGEWIEGENGNIKCNKCGCEIRYSYLVGNKPDYPKFCCDCGAKMKSNKKQ